MNIPLSKVHREIEKNFELEKNSLKKSVADLINIHKYNKNEILLAVKEAVEFCKESPELNNNKGFEVTFCMYVSVLNDQKKKNDKLSK